MMADLRERAAAHAGATVPLFENAADQPRVVLRDTTMESPRRVVGAGVTAAKRSALRAVWPVLADLVVQINAALLELDSITERLEALEIGHDGRKASGVANVASLRAELHDARQRLAALEAVTASERLARLEAGSPRVVLPRAEEPLPADPALFALAVTHARTDRAEESRAAEYGALLGDSGPVLDLSLKADGSALTPEGMNPLDALEKAEPNSLAGILAAGTGDHLGAGEWADFVARAAAALRPRGVLVLEMINSTTPAGMALRSRNPLLAPPVHPDTVAFLLRAQGLSDVEVRYFGEFPDDTRLTTTPDPDWFQSQLNEVAQKVNELVVGEPYVAVIARR